MTGLLCGPEWGRGGGGGEGGGGGGIFISKKALPVPGNLGQVLKPAFLRTLPEVGSK